MSKHIARSSCSLFHHFLAAGGLLFTRDSVNMQYTTTAALILSIYSKALKSSGYDGVRCSAATFSQDQIASFAASQVGFTIISVYPRLILHCSVSDNASGFRSITSWGRTP